MPRLDLKEGGGRKKEKKLFVLTQILLQLRVLQTTISLMNDIKLSDIPNKVSL